MKGVTNLIRQLFKPWEVAVLRNFNFAWRPVISFLAAKTTSELFPENVCQRPGSEWPSFICRSFLQVKVYSRKNPASSGATQLLFLEVTHTLVGDRRAMCGVLRLWKRRALKGQDLIKFIIAAVPSGTFFSETGTVFIVCGGEGHGDQQCGLVPLSWFIRSCQPFTHHPCKRQHGAKGNYILVLSHK